MLQEAEQIGNPPVAALSVQVLQDLICYPSRAWPTPKDIRTSGRFVPYGGAEGVANLRKDVNPK
jgi:hypothetical protein